MPPQPPKSRFFDGNSSSEEEESDFEDRSSEEEDSDDESGSDSGSESGSDSDGESAGGDGFDFLKSDDESEESEDEEKVTIVKSAKDKRLEGLENSIRLIENAQKINDWAVISTGESALHDLGGFICGLKSLPAGPDRKRGSPSYWSEC